jgi:hypothetical protein
LSADTRIAVRFGQSRVSALEMQRDNIDPRDPELDETLKPDLPRSSDPLSPSEAIREQRDTYGEDSTFPNREDQEDEHAGADGE